MFTKLVLPFIITVLHGNIKTRQFNLPDDLVTLCPDTKFCNASGNHVTVANFSRPCCGACSCHADCGLERSCCTYEMDTYRLDEKKVSSCVKAVVYTGRNEPLGVNWYHMIDTCPNGSTCNTSATDGSNHLFPYYCVKDKNIYFNKECGVCNNATDLIPWQVVFVCNLGHSVGHISDFTVSVNNLLDGEYYDESCSLHFIPPTKIDVPYKRCFPESKIIRDCPLGGRNSTMAQQYDINCKSFNASYEIQISGERFVYANVYCALCNNEVRTGCIIDSEDLKAPLGSMMLLMHSFDYRNVKEKADGKEICVMVFIFLFICVVKRDNHCFYKNVCSTIKLHEGHCKSVS